MPRLLAVALVLLVGGCVEEFDPASLVTRTRVLGARYEPDADPDRASAAPGETGRVRWYVAHPAEAEPLAWGFAVCGAAPVNAGQSFCAAAPFAMDLQADPVLGVEPALTLTVPPREALGAAETLLVLGIVCVRGSPVLGSDRMATCEGEDAEATPVSFEIPLEGEGAPNRHPAPPDDLRLGDEVWRAPPEALPFEGCADGAEVDGVPRLSRAGDGVEVELALATDPAAREDTGDGRESLVVSQFATAGKLARQFSVFDGTQHEATVAWELPPAREIPDGGLLVRFFFVVRDGRAGLDWATRAACVRP